MKDKKNGFGRVGKYEVRNLWQRSRGETMRASPGAVRVERKEEESKVNEKNDLGDTNRMDDSKSKSKCI